MATITPYKIATRTWANNTMGSAAKFSYSTGNDCLIVSDINQDSSAYLVTPSSTVNGAIPSSYLSNSTKCIKQSDLDEYYKEKYVSVDTTIKYKSNLAAFNAYHIKISCNYCNALENNSYPNYPMRTGILKDLTTNVSIVCSNKLNNRIIASTDCSCVLTAAPNNNSTKIEAICLDASNGASIVGNPTGAISNAHFLGYYLKDMYKYYNNGDSSYAYNITASITPEYGVMYNSPFEPQKYIPTINNVVTSTSDTNLSASITYNCTSGPDIVRPNALNTWAYTMTVSNITPTVTSSIASYTTLSVDKGDITVNKSWNSSTKTLTITGTVTYTPGAEELRIVPIIDFSYKRTGYTTLNRKIPVNVTNVQIKG